MGRLVVILDASDVRAGCARTIEYHALRELGIDVLALDEAAAQLGSIKLTGTLSQKAQAGEKYLGLVRARAAEDLDYTELARELKARYNVQLINSASEFDALMSWPNIPSSPQDLPLYRLRSNASPTRADKLAAYTLEAAMNAISPVGSAYTITPDFPLLINDTLTELRLMAAHQIAVAGPSTSAHPLEAPSENFDTAQLRISRAHVLAAQGIRATALYLYGQHILTFGEKNTHDLPPEALVQAAAFEIGTLVAAEMQMRQDGSWVLLDIFDGSLVDFPQGFPPKLYYASILRSICVDI